MQAEELFASVFVFGMMAGVFVIFMAMRQRAQQLDMQHRERMALIERGQVPPDPPAPRLIPGSARSSAAGARSMTLGIVVVAFGLGLMSIIGIAAGAPEVAVGIGGAIVILGLAFIANSLINRSTAPDPPPPPRHEDVR